ncbi:MULTISPECIES: type VI secretion system baseplate subunit TssF [unclassified Caballeronia]|uniref:type VI secretion system baseplate subunit TssF n=1 Tax=unclassified Caballeronia TaxID=2646786 RepID=UPI00285D6B97|nr:MULTISPECIES: type VI secretion system baseplate subunit TssF [unclassified Caballeronia]MDR5753754.1 type VI secretion system baseplate subunit TssF [Caballeronia sp. LZ024]MDR5840133.1 type VI secretion system baseplate subunit TssF [Caballeronia sp. LZ031]
MDPRLLRHYNTELAHLREMGAEFAQQFPKIAARLGMSGIDVADPYVERLLEGTAFLAARVQLKLEEEFPRFTQQLTHVVLPQAACPTPAMLIARLAPDLTSPNLAEGFTVPRHTALFASRAPGQTTSCEFRTSADLRLWPIELTEARYLAQVQDLPLAAMPATQALAPRVKGALRIRLATPEGLSFDALRLDALSLYFAGGDETAYRLFELVAGDTLAVVISTPERPSRALAALPGDAVTPAGFTDQEALLPVTPNAFQGYRVLHEYFALPERFRFARIEGLANVLPSFNAREIELTLLFGSGAASLERIVTKEHVLLDCVPAINLFPKQADRALVTEANARFHVIPDRTHPLDFEVHSVTAVSGYGAHDDTEQTFLPFYADFLADRPGDAAYYTLEREPRIVPAGRRKSGARTEYVGSETYVSIVDPNAAPYRGTLRQLAFATLCTNRDLPLMMQRSGAGSDFSLDIAAPVCAAKCVSGPSRPAPVSLDAGQSWRLIDQLSLHYLSLGNGPREAAAALRALLMLHVPPTDQAGRAQVGGVVSVEAKPVVRRLPMPGPIAFGRGLSIHVLVDDLAFQGGSAWLFGCVLDRFFSRYVSINSFVQTVLATNARGDILRLPPRCGTRALF